MCAYQQFLKFRWPPNGQPICPRCNCKDIYMCNSRKMFKCKDCAYHFSAKSMSIFASAKISYEKINKLIEHLNSNKNFNALVISKELHIQYRASWVLCAKIREAMDKYGTILGAPPSEQFTGYYQS